MTEPKLLQIRETIKLAKAQEAQTQELQKFLESSLPRLHHAIDLPKQDPSQALLDFVVQYIQQVPDILETLTQVLKETGTYESCEVFVTIAQEFFLKPPEIIQNHKGLQALIDEAYLAHRLIEEVNDRLMLLSGAQLVPLDMTLPNIVIHDLLGEDFANQLDLAVHYAIEALFQDAVLDQTQLKRIAQSTAWVHHLASIPSLANHQDVHLKLNTPTTPQSVH